MPEMWSEGNPYNSEIIYDISNSTHPPVNYSQHTFKPHSLTHMEAPSHTIKNGRTVDYYFKDLNNFIGSAIVIKLKGDHYKQTHRNSQIYHWRISKSQLQNELKKFKSIPGKVIITTETYPVIKAGFHDPKYVLTLSQEAADLLVSLPQFHMYGTSWKSSDYNPNSKMRPIHKTLFQKAYIVENLILDSVPEGIYEYIGVPLFLEGASESPVTPILRKISTIEHS